MKLNGYKKITGKLRCESGLHIGGSADQIEIGGVDLPIIKHPRSGEPYIPGSSLKGKMRSLLEKETQVFKKNGEETDEEPCGCGKLECKICKIFGAHKNTKHNMGATRILVRDAVFTKDTSKEDRQTIEKKVENIVNRKTGTAEHPRSLERVPSGAEFDIEIVLQVYDGDNENEMVEYVKKGLRHIQSTYLGGFGSRGSGKVSFHGMEVDGVKFDL